MILPDRYIRHLLYLSAVWKCGDHMENGWELQGKGLLPALQWAVRLWAKEYLPVGRKHRDHSHQTDQKSDTARNSHPDGDCERQ